MQEPKLQILTGIDMSSELLPIICREGSPSEGAADKELLKHLALMGLGDAPGIERYLVRATKGTLMFREGETCRCYPVVLAGVIRVGRVAPAGQDVVFYRLHAGEGCVLSAACLLEEQRYLASALVEVDVSALLLPINMFRTCLAGNTSFRNFVFCQYAMRIRTLMTLVDSLRSERIAPRLARCLVARQEAGLLEATHAELAADIGTSREVVTRHLRALVRDGSIKQYRRGIHILDMAALQAVANEGAGLR